MIEGNLKNGCAAEITAVESSTTKMVNSLFMSYLDYKLQDLDIRALEFIFAPESNLTI